jgi:hypothetical protein
LKVKKVTILPHLTVLFRPHPSFTHASYKAKSLGGASQEVRRQRLLAHQKEKREELVSHAR